MPLPTDFDRALAYWSFGWLPSEKLPDVALDGGVAMVNSRKIMTTWCIGCLGLESSVTRHKVLPLNPDIQFCRLIATSSFAAKSGHEVLPGNPDITFAARNFNVA
jgi:hypothetical protein